MSLLSNEALHELIERGILENSCADNVNAASIDVILGHTFWVERDPRGLMDEGQHWPIVDMLDRNSCHLEKVIATETGIVVPPGGILLAQTVEVFNLPDWLSGEYKLKSTMARNFFNHLNAGWADAGWNDSVLTLEFVNHNQWHSIRVRPGQKCGQMIFFEHEEVPPEASYAKKGQYNGDKEATPGKGLK
jgi:deoxycytidine triphosphate deaminase